MADSRTDPQLVDALNRGGPDGDRAFEALYYRHRDWVVRLARRWTGNDEDALDVLQETFRYVLSKVPLTLTASMTTFLYPAVKNLSIAARRKRRRFISPADVAEMDLPADPEEPTGQRAALAQVLRALPDTHREVVLMRFLDDMSLEEIALALNIPTGTVKSRLHHALQTLRTDPRTQSYFTPD